MSTLLFFFNLRLDEARSNTRKDLVVVRMVGKQRIRIFEVEFRA